MMVSKTGTISRYDFQISKGVRFHEIQVSYRIHVPDPVPVPETPEPGMMFHITDYCTST